MQIAQIIHQFTQSPPGVFPRKALLAAVAKKKEITPHLLNLISDATANIGALAKRPNDLGYLYAMFLLAQFRERQAYAPLLNFFKEHGRNAIALTGDVVTESLGQLLAAVSGDDINPLQQTIEDSAIEPFVRAACMEALLCLVAWGNTNRQEIQNYLGNLLKKHLERQASHTWNYLAEAVTRLCDESCKDALRKAYDEGLISALYLNWQDAEKMLERGEGEKKADLEGDAGLAPITNVVAEMENWACFRPQDQRLHPQGHDLSPAPSTKVGRNEPCPCGSGKKYKKCCLRS